jgi:phage-related tail fiber protein
MRRLTAPLLALALLACQHNSRTAPTTPQQPPIRPSFAAAIPISTVVDGTTIVYDSGTSKLQRGALTGDVSASAGSGTTTVVSGSTSTAGKLQLTDSVASTSTTTAATPNAVKSAYDLAAAAVPNTRTVSTTSPLSGGGALSSNLTLTIASSSTSQSGAPAHRFDRKHEHEHGRHAQCGQDGV